MELGILKAVFEFVVEQQVNLSILFVVLIALERWGLGLFKSTWLYAYALAIPVCLGFINLPLQIKTSYGEAVSRYLVTPTEYSSSLLTKHSDWFAVSASVYLVVVVALFLLTLLIHIRYKKALNLAPYSPSSPSELSLGDDSKEQTAILYTSNQISSPLVLGLWNYKLVIPADHQTRFSTKALSLILEHEQVHIQRRDNLINMLALSLVILFWFNPLSWLAYATFRRLQELTCDERVLKNKNLKDKILYSKALLDCVTHTEVRMMAYSHYGDKHMMLQRLNLIKQNAKGSTLAKSTLLGTLLAVICTVAIAKQASNAEQEYAMPETRVEPLYPIEAAKAGVSGHVVLQFDIDQNGTTKNIRIVSQEPEATFGKSATKALSKWKYKSSKAGFKDVLVRLDFALEQPSASKEPIEQIHVEPRKVKAGIEAEGLMM